MVTFMNLRVTDLRLNLSMSSSVVFGLNSNPFNMGHSLAQPGRCMYYLLPRIFSIF